MRIVLISDTHLAAPAAAFLDNCRAAVRWIEAEAPDLVVHLGDVTADGVKDPDQFAVAAQVFAPISAPLMFLPGNHDVGEAVSHGETKEPSLDLGRLAAFRRTLGADAWVRRQQGWTLIGLDTQVFDHEAEAGRQWAWLDAALTQARGPLGLFLHKPMHHPELEIGDEHPRYVTRLARQALARRFAGLDLRFVASGHVHQALQFEHEGALQVWAPSTAFILPDTVQDTLGAKIVGVTVLELEGRAVCARVVQPPGMVRHDVLDHPEVYPQVAALRDARDEAP